MTSTDEHNWPSLDTSSSIPLFHQIFVVLREQIVSGVLQPGGRLPSEAAICAEFQVSRITAKRALDELAKEGLVTRSRGSGTIVKNRNASIPFVSTVEGWFENISRMADTTDVELLEFDYRPAPPHVAERLELDPGEEVQHSIRVRSYKGTPLSYLETWVPADIGHKYSASDLGNTPLLRLLEKDSLNIASAQQRISAAVAAPKIAKALKVQTGAALLDVRRVVRSGSSKAVEYICVLYRPDLFQFSMDLTRDGDADGIHWKVKTTEYVPGARPMPPSAEDQFDVK